MQRRKSNYTGFLAIGVAVAMIFASCGEKKTKEDAEIGTSEEMEQAKEKTADRADATFSDGMTGKVFHNYQRIRMALVNSDAGEVQKASRDLAESFSEQRKEIKEMATAMAETNDLEKQRELFAEFTAKVEPMFKDALAEGTIYKQFCPMAFDGKGGYWISNVDDIRNPYYGEKMLKCGKVVEAIGS